MKEQPYRLFAGGRIDRERPLRFTFDGETRAGFAGDTLASALLAHGVHLVGRSFKYHRPRGILAAGAEEPNALLQVGVGARTLPNQRATQVDLYDGLIASSQNCWPSLHFDLGAVNNLLSPLLPAGFYYKTFMWPPSFWGRYYERLIRRAAGLGRAPTEADPDFYDKMHVHCDVLVAGAGAAGLAAALAAGRTGARVILADEQSEPGGWLLGSKDRIDDAPAVEWADAALEELGAMDDVTLLPRTTVAAYYDHNYLLALERVGDHLPPGARPERPRQRLWKIRARQVVLATGAQERPLVFRNNDRPGIMLAGAARHYVNRYAVRPGESAVVFTNNDSAYAAAMDLSDCGMEVRIVDVRTDPPPAMVAAAKRRSVEVLAGHAVVMAHGRKRVREVTAAPLNARKDGYAGAPRALACDLVAMSGGLAPTVHLFSQSGGRLVHSPERACFVPGESVQAERSAGAANGTFALAFCLSEGREAGKAAAAAAGFRKRGGARSPKVESVPEHPMEALWVSPPLRPGAPTSKHFVDFQNDVSVADIALAVREGYRSVEHVKRYTTTGMGTDQGRTSNANAIAIIAGMLGEDPSQVGTTTFRPPCTPITFGALAGRDTGELADPVRTTPMHDWHVEHGARFEDVGQWKRPWYYPRPGESMRDAVDRECLATRNAVGILDATTLGKIDVQGPDAAEFLNRIYTNGFRRLPVGRCRYGLMCGEDGMVFDDGVAARLGEHHFLVSTTTGGAARVLAWLEEWHQTEWPELRVFMNSVTEQYAVASIAGPLARALLAELGGDVDLDPGSLPFMSWREGRVAGFPARVLRVSFSGESAFEINVAADFGPSLWTTLMRAGARYGITPYGTEAMHVLRAEKGFIIAGQESDGTVTPEDLGLAAMVGRQKDFIGKRSLFREDTRREDRKQLVGLLTEDPKEVLPEGAQIVERVSPRPPMPMIGHVTSSYHSANLGRSIALALLRGGRRRHGQRVMLPLARKTVAATVTSPVFIDPDGERMRA